MRSKGCLLIALSICCGLSFCVVRADTEDTYPHVTQLETYILGQTFVGEALPARLARMEKKAFGTESTDPDLSARSDALTDYADQKLGKRTPVASDSDDMDSSGGTAGDASVPQSQQSDYPHITTLEKEILGQTYPQEALSARISRMEMKAFGATSTDPDLTNRTDSLDAYAQKTLHKESFDKQQAQEAAREGYLPAGGGGAGGGGSGASKAKHVLGFLGNQLLNMAVPVPGLGNTMVGARAVPASGSPQDSTPERPPEDPAVFAATPPPADARMITQIGWCEMRLFGHTSPQLHLAERLEQINLELNYAPTKKGAELMDDMAKLVQAVAVRTH
jgi:hypothetical protein